MENYLAHLTSEEVYSLMARYYDGENAKKLIQVYKLKITPSRLYKCFPPEECSDYICDYCDVILVLDRVSKTNKDKPRYESELYCPTCGHEPYVNNCKCDNCIEAKTQKEKAKEKLIYDTYCKTSEPHDFDSLSFREKVYLGVLCKNSLNESMSVLLPQEQAQTKIAPCDILRADIYDTLFNKRIIAVHPISSVAAFTDKDDFPNTFYTYKVAYQLNLTFEADRNATLDKILNPQYFSEINNTEALAIWREIAVAECIEYLLYQLERVSFEFNPGEKTYAVINIMLNDFSVSQIYGIIWKSVADASKLYLEKGISRKQAANSVIGACERLADRARVSGWDMNKYSRVKDLPQTTLSEFFFNRVIKIGQLGFDMPPTNLY